MTISVASGRFLIPQSTGINDIDQSAAVGFEPKALIFMTALQNNASVAINQFGLGAASGIGDTQQWAIGGCSRDGLSNSVTAKEISNGLVIVSPYNPNNGTPHYVGNVKLSEIGPTGFRCSTIVAATGSTFYANWLAIGGDISADAALTAVPIGTGNTNISTPGVNPSFVLMASNGGTTQNRTTDANQWSIGAAVSASSRISVAISDLGNLGTMNAGRGSDKTRCIRMMNGNAWAASPIYDFVSFGTGGFTLNRIANTSAHLLGHLAIQGVTGEIVTEIAPGATGNQDVAFSAPQKAAIILSALTTVDSTQPYIYYSAGLVGSPSQAGHAGAIAHNVGTSAAWRGESAGNGFYSINVSTGATTGLASASFVGNNVRMNWTTAGISGNQYWVIGLADGAGPGPGPGPSGQGRSKLYGPNQVLHKKGTIMSDGGPSTFINRPRKPDAT